MNTPTRPPMSDLRVNIRTDLLNELLETAPGLSVTRMINSAIATALTHKDQLKEDAQSVKSTWKPKK